MTGPIFSHAEILAELERAVRGAGLCPNPFISDSFSIVRCPTIDKPKSMNGAYRVFDDAFPRVWFMDWQTRKEGSFSPYLKPSTPEQRKAYRAQEEYLAAERAKRDVDDKRLKKEAAGRALTLWNAAKPDNPHSYLALKNVSAHGARVIGSDEAKRLDKLLRPSLHGPLLLIPAYDEAGQISTLQLIDDNAHHKGEDGKPKTPIKNFLKNGRKRGCVFLIGGPVQGFLVICEGFATGASIHEATGLPVAVAFDTGGLLPGAENLLKQHPSVRLLFAADDDYKPEKPDENPGFEAAEKAALATGGAVVKPTRRAGATDFNDLANDPDFGPETVKKCFAPFLCDEAPREETPVLSSSSGGNAAPPGGGDDGDEEAADYPDYQFGARHYWMDENGVWCQEGKKPPLQLCEKIHVRAKTSTEKGEGWGRWLEWHDPAGALHSFAMPMKLLQKDGVELREILADGGLHISVNKYARELLEEYFQTCPANGHYLCVDRPGWHDDAYILPNSDEPIGETGGKKVVYQGTPAPKGSLDRKGTVEDWREAIGKRVAGNSRLVFPLCVGLAAPLLGIIGAGSGGFHIRGGSSSGKTTGLRLAGSLFGSPRSSVRTWRATDNALENICVEHNDRLLVLDEIGQVEPGKIGDISYMIANGQGKARASRSSLARAAAQWRTLVLSSGEEGLPI